jgi:hypothetical protein
VTWLWLALVDGPPPREPLAAAEVTTPEGSPAGALAAWPADRHPPVRAVKVDGRAIAPGGRPARVSLVLLPPRVRLPFDDLAVQGARRAVLAGPPRRLVSTLVRGDSIFAGAITALPDGEPDGAVADPFGRVFPARLLRVGAGLLGSVPPPAGPVIERYGSGNPWPWDRFAT